jgi:hypothetical protein
MRINFPIAAALALLLLAAGDVCAQRLPRVHHRYQGSWPPGTIGQYQLRGDVRRIGYFQPVEIQAPEGSTVSAAVGGAFAEPQEGSLKVGLQIGSVYRFRVTRIPLREGSEVFPTIELLDRLHPPDGLKWRFPIPVQLTAEELQMALEGRLVTRVIYVENPTQALPLVQDPKLQRWFEVRPDADPLETADAIGRPVAILRIGSRVPTGDGPDEAFLFGSPPLEQFIPQELIPTGEELPQQIAP